MNSLIGYRFSDLQHAVRYNLVHKPIACRRVHWRNLPSGKNWHRV